MASFLYHIHHAAALLVGGCAATVDTHNDTWSPPTTDRGFPDRPAFAGFQEAAIQRAIRANRHLSLAFQAQGMTIEAAELAYRVRDLQRILAGIQRRYGEWLLAWGLRLIAGYGYRLRRSFLAYLITLFVFWAIYISHPIVTITSVPHAVLVHHVAQIIMTTTRTVTNLTWEQAAIMSVTSFHGRGLFPSEIATSLWHGAFAAVEAFIGLLIEATFIATLTQRFFR